MRGERKVKDHQKPGSNMGEFKKGIHKGTRVPVRGDLKKKTTHLI